MADEADRVNAAGEYEDLPAEERVNFEDDAVCQKVRPFYQAVFSFLSMSDTVEASVDGTQQLGLSREGFTYGETRLGSVWRMLQHMHLSEYSNHGAGANLVDLGSGVGNVVVAAALLHASGRLSAPLASVRGFELLPPLHDVAATALERLEAWGECATGPGRVLPLRLPRCTVECANLLDADLDDADIVYVR